MHWMISICSLIWSVARHQMFGSLIFNRSQVLLERRRIKLRDLPGRLARAPRAFFHLVLAYIRIRRQVAPHR